VSQPALRQKPADFAIAKQLLNRLRIAERLNIFGNLTLTLLFR